MGRNFFIGKKYQKYISFIENIENKKYEEVITFLKDYVPFSIAISDSFKIISN